MKKIIKIVRFYLKPFSILLQFALPYLMLWIAGKDKEWYIYLIPVLFWILIFILNNLSNKYGRGETIPIPRERFTEVSIDGEVSIYSDRLQELLLYVADLEDWMERKGML